MRKDIFELDIKDFEVGRATKTSVNFPSFYGLQDVTAPLFVYRGSEKISPCVVVTACVHGDEINGMRIAQSLIEENLNLIQGTLIVLPVVNIYGFFNKLRYLPDRKDLNRCFPGNTKGSFGSRFADFIFKNITKYGDVFIDLHSGPPGRFNIPQIRADLSSEETMQLVQEASIPIVVNSNLRDGSMRAAIRDLKKNSIVFEGGEGLRIDEVVTKYGLNLIKSILHKQNMIDESVEFNEAKIFIHKTKWVRALQGGVFINTSQYGEVVKKGDILGEIRNTTGELIEEIEMEKDGVILGLSNSALIMTGDPLYNIGILDEKDELDDEEEFFDYFDFEM